MTSPPGCTLFRRRALPLVALLAVCIASIGCIIPGSPQADSFQSGGIGLTRAEWEKTHKPDPLATHIGWERAAYYPESRYGVTYWHEDPQSQKPEDARIAEFIYKTRNPTSEGQLAEMVALLPADAQLQEKGQITGNVQARGDLWYIYHSQSLETRYPPLPDAPDPWKGKTPGTIYLECCYNGNGVTIRAQLARLPYKLPPTEPPPTITPFVLLPTAIPTLPGPPKPVPSLPPPIPSIPQRTP
jgi:hypothetical protein